MGDSLAERVEALERKARWLRGWVLVLSVALIGLGIAGASGPQELTLRKLTIEDSDGKPRILAHSDPNGLAELDFGDRDGKLRILAYTRPDGVAGLQFSDRDGKLRIAASTNPMASLGSSSQTATRSSASTPPPTRRATRRSTSSTRKGRRASTRLPRRPVCRPLASPTPRSA